MSFILNLHQGKHPKLVLIRVRNIEHILYNRINKSEIYSCQRSFN